MAAPDIVNVTSILGKTAVSAITTSATDLLTNAAASNKVYKVNTVIVSNIDGTNSADITVDIYRSSTAYHLVKTVAVDANSSFSAIDKNIQIYLEEGDSIRLTASAAGDLEAICSYEEIS